MKVAIQGLKGAFHEMAATSYFGSDAELIYFDTFTEVFDALKTGAATSAVVAIGNSRYGDISNVYDIMIKNHLEKNSNHVFWIGGEVYVKIEQCMLGVPGTTLETIHEVHSQAPALGQCHDFLHSKIPNVTLVEEDDTAKSARLVSEWADTTKAAIASRAAAQIYNLEVIAENIQDDPLNITRFLVIESDVPAADSGSTKTSLLLNTLDEPGSLVSALQLFSENGVNLSYIQSVPIPDKHFRYRFYIDLEAGAEDKRVTKVLETLKSRGYVVDILGSYKNATMPKG